MNDEYRLRANWVLLIVNPAPFAVKCFLTLSCLDESIRLLKGRRKYEWGKKSDFFPHVDQRAG